MFAAQIAGSPGTSDDVQIATIGWGPDNGFDKPSEIQIRLKNEEILVKHDEDPTPGVDEYGTAKFKYPVGGWFDVDVQLQFDGKNVILDAKAGGMVLWSKSFVALSSPVDPDVGIGIAGITGTFSSFAVHYDDVFVDFK